MDKLDLFLRKLKKLPLIKKLAILGVCFALVLSGVGINHFQKLKQEPKGRMETVVSLIKNGEFKQLNNYTNDKKYFATLNIIGDDASDKQKRELAKLLYENVSSQVTDVVINKAESKAVVTVKVSNYNVYIPSLDVEISEKEMKGKSQKQKYDLLIAKAKTAIARSIEKQKEKPQNTLAFLLTKNKNGDWIIDAKDQQNQLNLLGFLGVPINNIKIPTTSSSEDETTANKTQQKTKQPISPTTQSTTSEYTTKQ